MKILHLISKIKWYLWTDGPKNVIVGVYIGMFSVLGQSNNLSEFWKVKEPVSKVEEAVGRTASVYPLSSEVKRRPIVFDGQNSASDPVSGLYDQNVFHSIFHLGTIEHSLARVSCPILKKKYKRVLHQNGVALEAI